MFSDESKAFKALQSILSCTELQDDIDKLVEWTQTWQMKFNPEKCKILRLGNNSYLFKYTITQLKTM